MQIHLHQTHHGIGDFSSVFSYLKNCHFEKKILHLFPELFLTGYPLQDLCLQRPFINSYLQFVKELNQWASGLEGESVALLGGLSYVFDEEGLPQHIKNVIFELRPGKPLKEIYTKKLLPNYDIFDEQKYFTAGVQTTVASIFGKNIAVLICEDMWHSSLHPVDPVEDLRKKCLNENMTLDLIVNLSASPYHLGKQAAREERVKEISMSLGATMIFVNRVGAEDEVIFDGRSFAVAGNEIVAKAKKFASDLITFDGPFYQGKISEKPSFDFVSNTWEKLFAPNIIQQKNQLPQLKPLSDEDMDDLLNAMQLSLADYARKSGMDKFQIALSGGIDSALVLAIAYLTLKDPSRIEAIYMPGFFSATLGHDLSKQMCERLGVRMATLPIKFLHSSIKMAFNDSFKTPLDGLADENIQSRLRGALLYARSNQTGSMVLNTSNKSELSVGYSTLYGDSVGALSVLGDLYKSEVFSLAHFINRKFGNLIPEGVIERAPSAELREGQTDQESLPPYQRLDTILEGILSYRLDLDELVKMGLDGEEVKKVYRLYLKSEYKRFQFCPIMKLKSKSFGFGYRVPICKNMQISLK